MKYPSNQKHWATDNISKIYTVYYGIYILFVCNMKQSNTTLYNCKLPNISGFISPCASPEMH